MMFDDLQEVQQVWRYTTPSGYYSEVAWSGSLLNAFSQARANVELEVSVSGTGTLFLSLGSTPFLTVVVASGSLVTMSGSFNGTTFYTGLNLVATSGLTASVVKTYVGDATIATKDDVWVDGVWKYVTSITGRIEPLGAGYLALRNNQTFADISEFDYIPLSYKNLVLPNDGIIDADGVQRQVVGIPEVYKHMLEHIVLYLKRAQWEVT